MTSVGQATFLTAGRTDPGLQRDVNEDRFHLDTARGLFLVIDGVGGQAAGGKAADVALAMVRERLERETGPVADRLREAIAIANNEIHRLASTRPEWEGMACVLTAAIVKDGKATFGHVGDTRLYKIRENRMEKITRDHSPVGEREDAGELSESQAMRHPRRNEVYRDVGSEPHVSADADFIDVDEVAFEPDAALLLCTDGLTDLVDASSIARTVRQLAGDPEAVVQALIDAANAAGGKDNVTVVYVEGDRFATSQRGVATPTAVVSPPPTPAPTRFVRWTIATLLLVVVGFAIARTEFPILSFQLPPAAPVRAGADAFVVQPTGSIAAAIRDAAAGSEIIIEPGEYREQIVLKDRIRVVSRVPHAARIRLPVAVPDAQPIPAVLARDISGAEVVGLAIVGDSATPLAVGVYVKDSVVSIVDVEITGATIAAVEFSGGGPSALLGSDIRDNPGAAIIVRDGASPRIAHNSFLRNAASERAEGAFIVEAGAAPLFFRNVFLALTPDSFSTMGSAARLALKTNNWFVPLTERTPSRPNPSVRSQRNR
jgi:serine/threonine protein phosphatase PrpC